MGQPSGRSLEESAEGSPFFEAGKAVGVRGRFDRIALKVPKMATPHVADPVVTANGDIWRRRVVTRDKQVKQRS
jgi:hypothetical protein